MSFNRLAQEDFERAITKGFWRRVLSFLTGADNQLLPFDEVRDHLLARGQHDAGLQQINIEQVVGSLGRYHDFDRAFLPTQRRSKERWVRIGQAHYNQVALPPVELYKIGDAYFVKDGNHRISVARERGQIFIDAYVIEISTPIRLTPGMGTDDLLLEKQRAVFIEKTKLDQLRPGAQVEVTMPQLYEQLLEHIDVHRWYMGEDQNREVPYEEAVISWYDTVYRPLVQEIREHELCRFFSGSSEAELYLWILEYQSFLLQAYQYEGEAEENAKAAAARQLMDEYPLPAVRKLISVLSRTDWLDKLILERERVEFLEQTRILDIRPQAQIVTSLPGQYRRLREHISVHRWYLGEQQNGEVPYIEALASWYDNVYKPLVEIIQEHNILEEFPGRTETDLYLWVIKHQWHLREVYGNGISFEQAAEQFADEHTERPLKKTLRKIRQAIGLE